MKITDVCIRNPVLAWMLMAATVVFGLVAFSRIGISQFPDVDFPNINVRVTWEGAAPEAVESEVVEELEEELSQVEGVKSITSTSRQGLADITVELDLGRNVDLALQDVQTKVSHAQRRLPVDIDPPVISKSNPEDSPIMWIGLSGPYSRQVLADYARYRLQDKLQTIAGVGEVMMGGYLDRNIRIWVNADKLTAKGLTVVDVLGALQREHVELPAGHLITPGREVSVRIMGEALDLKTLRNIVVRQVGGAPVRLSDVALVEDGFEDVRRIARSDGLPVQGLGVKKQRGANAVQVARDVREELVGINRDLPEGMHADVVFDSARFIEQAVHHIEWELIAAVLLTALVCWMFLGSLSSTFNVVLAIPMSLLGTIAIDYFLGFTLNTFTLLALSLAVGIVVDDAIMVMENIFRHAEAGKDKVRAAREGTGEIAFAALAASAAVIAIFTPVIFMNGVIGKFFLQFGVTLSIAVALSYLEAVTLAPSRCAQILKLGGKRSTWLGRAVDGGFERLSRLYGRILRHSLRWPLATLVAAAVLFALSLGAFRTLPAEFVPSQDQSRLMIRLQTGTGSDISETDGLFKRAEAIVNGCPEVERAMSIIGGFGGSEVNVGRMFVTLVPPDRRSMSQADVAQILRKKLNAIPGLRAVVQDLSQQGFTARRGFPIEFSVRGPDWDKLVTLSGTLERKLAESGLAVDVDTDYEVGVPELRVVPSRDRDADLGVSVSDVATTINALVGGVRAGKYSSGGRRIDVRVQLMADQRARPGDIGKLRVRTRSGELVPLSSLVTQKELPALQQILRMDRERAISIFANVAPGHSQDEALAFVESMRRGLPPGYRVVLGGASVAFRDSMSGLLFALMLGILVAYMVLASQFNSFLHPVTVITILPLSVVGAAFALLWTGMSLSIFSMIGILLLLGIVKKNSILLVDFANQVRRSDGLDAHEAMLRAGPVRLRPILMTSIATMMAALPTAMGLGAGYETRQPMSIAVIGGLVVSTALSLLVVPAFYVVSDRAKGRLARLLLRREQPR